MSIQTKTDEQLKTFAGKLHGIMVSQDANAFDTLLQEKMPDVKTKKSAGARASVGNATLLVRFAKHCGVENPLVESYYDGNSGPNATNDIVNLQQIAGQVVVKHGTDNSTALFGALSSWVNSFAPKESPKPQPKASTMPTISPMTSIDNDEDFQDDEEEEEEEADATESRTVLDDFSQSVKRTIKAVTDEEIAQAKATLHKTNKNGDGYEMSLKGRSELNPKQLANAIDWDIQLLKAAADILCIAPKRNKKWTDAKTGKTYKTRSWFPELCNAGNYQAAKRFTLQMAAYVVNCSERNFWTARFAWSVSDDFREGFRAFIGINEEVADSAVIGGQAQSWHWPLVKNDWTPTSSGKMTDVDYNNLDIGSLDSL